MVSGYLDRIIHDGKDRAGWEAARYGIFGASDAAGFAKITSVDKYVAAKMREEHFAGNSRTAEGHRWEPMMLAWAGIPQNTALIAHPSIPNLAATPDGLGVGPSGELALAECKARIRRITDGPSLGEWRQIALQLDVVPEADTLHFLWVELVGPDDNLQMRTDAPHEVVITRDHPKVIAAREQMLPIAVEAAAQLRAALEFKEALAS